MHALRKIDRALAPGGLVIDTQPVSAYPPVESDNGTIGTLDMSEWARTIATIDQYVEQAIGDGLFELVQERRYVVTDEYDDGEMCVAITRGWQGTHLDEAFAELVARERGPVRLHQDIRLRLLRTR